MRVIFDFTQCTYIVSKNVWMSRFRDRFFLNFYCLKQSVFKEKELSCVLQNNAKDINIEEKIFVIYQQIMVPHFTAKFVHVYMLLCHTLYIVN